MKKKVELSYYCWIISALSFALLCGIMVYASQQPGNEWAVVILGISIALLFGLTLFYMPVSVSLDSDALKINRPIRSKRIPLTDIQSVKLCPPTMGAKRICGSGGWFGWYGWFSERDLGKYFAYYGKSSDCFLVTLKSGKKYMLGCQDAPEMVESINMSIH